MLHVLLNYLISRLWVMRDQCSLRWLHLNPLTSVSSVLTLRMMRPLTRSTQNLILLIMISRFFYLFSSFSFFASILSYFYTFLYIYIYSLFDRWMHRDFFIQGIVIIAKKSVFILVFFKIMFCVFRGRHWNYRLQKLKLSTDHHGSR